MSRRKLLVDCDAGCDDASALLMAIHHDDVEIVGITAVNGNTPVDDVTRNILQVLRFVNRQEVPVFRGSVVSLAGHASKASGFHGNDGMGDCLDPSLVDMSRLKDEPAASAIVRLANQHKGEVSLVATGPLTNIAVALHLDPDLGSKLNGFYVMGGNSSGAGNVTPSAEFNFYADPEAARMVLDEMKIPITLVPMEICLENTFTWDEYEKLTELPHRNAKFIEQIDRVFVENGRKSGYEQYPAFDQLAMAVFLERHIATETKDVYATVCTDTGVCRGHMIIDWKGRYSKSPNIRLVTAVDQERYLKMLWKVVTV